MYCRLMGRRSLNLSSLTAKGELACHSVKKGLQIQMASETVLKKECTFNKYWNEQTRDMENGKRFKTFSKAHCKPRYPPYLFSRQLII